MLSSLRSWALDSHKVWQVFVRYFDLCSNITSSGVFPDWLTCSSSDIPFFFPLPNIYNFGFWILLCYPQLNRIVYVFAHFYFPSPLLSLGVIKCFHLVSSNLQEWLPRSGHLTCAYCMNEWVSGLCDIVGKYVLFWAGWEAREEFLVAF